MKPFSLLFALILGSQFLSAALSDSDEAALYTDYGQLLDKYATDTGVEYARWKSNKEDLASIEKILERWAKLDLTKLNKAQQKAFYINLYNLGMLQAVFDNYPIKSVTDILPNFGIFKHKFIKQGGRTLSLDDVEKGILLKEYPDARIHWAVNCASRSCPPLRAEPFTSKKLDQQMDEQAAIYLNDQWGVQLKGREAHISALFDWYRSDFPEGNLLEYINQHRKGTPIPASSKIKFLHYDWALNSPISD